MDLHGQARRAAVLKVRALLAEHADRVSGLDAFLAIIDLLDERAMVYDASQYIYAFARHQGYYLPPFPLAGCGEIKEFLSDQGVRDLPGWYAHIGMDQRQYADIYSYQLLVLVDDRFRRQAIPLKAGWDKRPCTDPALDSRYGELALYSIDYVVGDTDRVLTVLFE